MHEAHKKARFVFGKIGKGISLLQQKDTFMSF